MGCPMGGWGGGEFPRLPRLVTTGVNPPKEVGSFHAIQWTLCKIVHCLGGGQAMDDGLMDRKLSAYLATMRVQPIKM